MIAQLKDKDRSKPNAVAVTATTGIAAIRIGGITIHSFASVGYVSLLDGALFNKLSEIGSSLRNSRLPFGGLQLLVTGDFFQLPPVARGDASPTFTLEAAH
ncbi:hypothetical protein R3P38DRAFT_2798467 [Favolaschia claudopus]|uniref:ATP-dependent DNA helicase n=1 Tax=Favolaschia claudopus TaxID=2862362 RepID=A0AAW0A1J8_9AGAR